MTLHEERTRAVAETLRFLYTLLDPQITPRVPRNVRERARSLIKHYPTALDMERPGKAFKS